MSESLGEREMLWEHEPAAFSNSFMFSFSFRKHCDEKGTIFSTLVIKM